MSHWAIAYEVDVEGMKQAGCTKSDAVNFYNEVQACFAESNFSKSRQLTLYTSDQANAVPDAYHVCRCLARVPNVDKFLTRIYLMRIDEFHDLLPLLVPGKASALADHVWDEIESVFPDEEF